MTFSLGGIMPTPSIATAASTIKEKPMGFAWVKTLKIPCGGWVLLKPKTS
jgi:hypothetical protein